MNRLDTIFVQYCQSMQIERLNEYILKILGAHSESAVTLYTLILSNISTYLI